MSGNNAGNKQNSNVKLFGKKLDCVRGGTSTQKSIQALEKLEQRGNMEASAPIESSSRLLLNLFPPAAYYCCAVIT